MKLQRWTIDPNGTSVTFTASSSIHPIRSSGNASGWFEAAFDDAGYALDHATQGRLEVPIAGLLSGNPLVDREMRRRVDTTA